MAIDQVLLSLFNDLSKHKKIVLSWAAIQLWQPKAFELLLKNHIIKATYKAENIQCQTCEKYCTVDVTQHDYPNNKIRYYAVCVDDYMHEQVGRMTIPSEQLMQWQCSTKQLLKVISRLLDIDKEITFSVNTEQTRLGMLAKEAGRKWVTLIHDPLALEINQMILPLEEILYFDGDSLALDMDRVTYALNLKQHAQIKGYSPNVNQREKGKFNTQAMHQGWQGEAVKLKKKYPQHSKTWISKQIAKLSMAQGRNAETIRKSIDI